ncbi:MAG: NDP-hexose 2,3-dehydratase family protein [Oscillospiraceae bacterium]
MMADRRTIINKCVESWQTAEGVNSAQELLEWINELNNTIKVDISFAEMEEEDFWFYDDLSGRIRNRNNSFFSISGMRTVNEAGEISEQPVLLQNEIGYLGIICAPINGVLHFLMQAKIEPGNINKVQISPTIQATKSNFQRKHGGKAPAYAEYFVNDSRFYRLVDQIQSEQSSRFLGKRNRNTVIFAEDGSAIDVLPNFRWMTLGQIKALMGYDNLVNMDTRTVLSCIPFWEYEGGVQLSPFLSMLFGSSDNNITEVYTAINDKKMFSSTERTLIPLSELEHWHWQDGSFVCDTEADFSVVYCDISIEGREVRQWRQPLFKAAGDAVFGLAFCRKADGIRFLVRIKEESGCFDVCELGPTVQLEPTKKDCPDPVSQRFMELCGRNGTVFDGLLSEEGGRFYNEQNRNILLECSSDDFGELPEDCFWMDFRTLNSLTQINNILNIQLRNLLSLLPDNIS